MLFLGPKKAEELLSPSGEETGGEEKRSVQGRRRKERVEWRDGDVVVEVEMKRKKIIMYIP